MQPETVLLKSIYRKISEKKIEQNILVVNKNYIDQGLFEIVVFNDPIFLFIISYFENLSRYNLKTPFGLIDLIRF